MAAPGSRRRTRGRITLDEARADLLRWANSYERLPMLLEFIQRGGLSRDDVLCLLGEEWQSCDNIGQHAEWIRLLLRDSTEPAMMTADETAALARLPGDVTIYRGADRGVNENGLCWSLDRAVAARFPFQMRYYAADPVLVTATIDRARIIALKLERDEQEIITTSARIVRVEPLGH